MEQQNIPPLPAERSRHLFFISAMLLHFWDPSNRIDFPIIPRTLADDKNPKETASL